jgi:hypothetical protein
VDAYHGPIENEFVTDDARDDTRADPAWRASWERRRSAEALIVTVWEKSASALPDPDPAAAERTFEGFLAREERRMEIERRAARQRSAELHRGVALARRARAGATTAAQEYAASETLGRALLMAGEWDAAIQTLRPLLPVLYPPRPALLLRRAYRHRGLSLDGSATRLWLGNPYSFDELEARKSHHLAAAVRVNEERARRFSRDGAQQLAVGWLYYDLAQARAAEEPGFPLPGPEYGRRVSAFVAVRYPELIDRGLAYCRQAEQLSRPGGSGSARALAGVGRGHLMRRRFGAAIQALEGALRHGPNPQAAEDLRQARLRHAERPG